MKKMVYGLVIGLMAAAPLHAAQQEQLDLATCFSRGVAHFKQQEYTQAQPWFEHAVTCDPQCSQAHFNLALIHTLNKNHDQAIASFKKAIACDPDYSKAHLFLGQEYAQHGKLENALEEFCATIALEPHNTDAHLLMARTLRALDRHEEAIISFNRTLGCNKKNVEARFELGNEYHATGELEKALEQYQIILQDHPDMLDVACNAAHTLRYLGRMKEAITYYTTVITARPEHAHTHYGLAESYLACGNFADGFKEFEWRWKRMEDHRNFSEKLWDGSSPAGKTLLLRAEYGQGDTMQFVRYAKTLKEQGATVIVEAQHSLVQLLSLCPYIDTVVPVADSLSHLPAHDAQLPIMSLPYIYKTTAETIPHEVPYLQAEPDLVQYWHKRMAQDKKFKIGICWEGSPYYESFRSPLSKKGIALATFAPLANVEGVSLYSLQKMDGTEQLNTLPDGMIVHDFGSDFDHTHGRFMDTAAIIKNLDLVITVDTSVAHLAGALGAKVWVMLPVVADWRWMQDRDDSPWYPTMRLFRQQTNGDWAALIEEITAEVAAFLTKRSPRKSPSLITTEVAIGELMDKITILEIKMDRISDPAKLRNIKAELEVLRTTYARTFTPSHELEELMTQLKKFNEQLWVIEDEIREKERKQEFDEQFIELARSVYFTNDKRCDVKRAINNLLGSRLMEEKSYTNYQTKAAPNVEKVLNS